MKNRAGNAQKDSKSLMGFREALKKKVIYLSALHLSYSMQGLPCVVWDLSSLFVTHGFQSTG